MSEGPIKSERSAWKPKNVTTTDKARVCFDVKGKGYCGRSSAKERTGDWKQVVCFDCIAAALADGVRLPKGIAA